jgi:hypothetical protein
MSVSIYQVQQWLLSDLGAAASWLIVPTDTIKQWFEKLLYTQWLLNSIVYNTYSPSISMTTPWSGFLYTVPVGQTAILLWAWFYVISDTGVTVEATAWFGTNNPAYDDLYTPIPLTWMLVTNDTFAMPQPWKRVIVPWWTDIYINITVGATAATQTAIAYLTLTLF